MVTTRFRGTPVFLFLAVLVAAINLRPAIVSVGSVLDDIIQTYGASETIAGIITATPGFAFALFGIAAVPIARRVGLSGALSLGMILTVIGIAVRPWVGDVWSFLFFTGFVVIGIAIANILLPAWIKLHGGTHTVALMMIYTIMLGVGSTFGPLTALLFSGVNAWRWAIFVWLFFALVQLALWLPMWIKKGHDFPVQTVTTQKLGRIWTSPSAVFIMLFFGIQSMNAYIQMGWLPKILIDAGVSASNASISLAIIGLMGIIGGFIMPIAIARTRNAHLQRLPVAFGLLTGAGYGGILLFAAPAWPLWSILLGVGGWCFPMAISLIPARTRDPRVTASLSGFAQPVGYLLAAVGPFLIGGLYQLLGSWDLILMLLILGTVLLAVVGYRAARSVIVDDELTL